MKKRRLVSILLIIYSSYVIAQTSPLQKMFERQRAIQEGRYQPPTQKTTQPVTPASQPPTPIAQPVQETAPITPPAPAQSLATAKVLRPLPQPTDQPKIKKLLETLQASSLDEAIENAQDVTELVDLSLKQGAQGLKGTYETVSNALGSNKLHKKVQEIKEDEQFLEHDTIVALNQLVFDEIFELKKRYFEAIKTITEFANPLINELKKIIDANNRNADLNTLKSLIPTAIPRMPSIKDMSQQELIQAIQKIQLD